MFGETGKTLESHHSGIEMGEGEEPPSNANSLESHHSGIEMEELRKSLGYPGKLESHHSGIEMLYDPTGNLRRPIVRIAPQWN